jgi:cell division protein FtsN
MPEFGMPATPPYEDHSALPLPPGGAENPTTALYRAALGPLNTERYLALFDRFDAAGRAGLVWNTAAGLCTLNWMAFRGLWGAALVYLAAAEGMALLVLGLGRHYFDWPAGVELGVLGSLLLLSVVVPGLYGNALLHAEVRRRMASAVTDAHTVREACEALEKQAPTRQRLQAFLAGNAVLGVVALVLFVAIRPGFAPSVVARPAPAAAAVVPPVEEKAAPVVAAPAADAASPPSPAVVVPPVLAPLPAPSVAVPAQVAQGVEKQDQIIEEPTPGPATPAVPAATAAPVMAPKPKGVVASAPVPAPAPSVASSAPGPALATPEAAPPVLAPPQGLSPHGINVGLFAEEANAIKVHTQLTEAGLPATMQTVEGPRGPRTRVRAGPFTDRASAEAAAQRIRAMGLEAQIYRQ